MNTVSRSTDKVFKFFLSSHFYFAIVVLVLLSLENILNFVRCSPGLLKKKLNNTSVNQYSIRIKFLSTKSLFLIMFVNKSMRSPLSLRKKNKTAACAKGPLNIGKNLII